METIFTKLLTLRMVNRFRLPDCSQFYLALKRSMAIIDHISNDAGSFIFELISFRWIINPDNQDYTVLDIAGYYVNNYRNDCEPWQLLIKENQGNCTPRINNARFNVTAAASIINFDKDINYSVTIGMTALLDSLVSSNKRKFKEVPKGSILIGKNIEIIDKINYLIKNDYSRCCAHSKRNHIKEKQRRVVSKYFSPEQFNCTCYRSRPPPLSQNK